VRQQRRGRHLISVATEHKAVLDPLARLARQGYEVTLIPVEQHGTADAGRIDLDRLNDALRSDTVLVSVMLANNEIGIVQPLAEVAAMCERSGAALHTDATQAVGKLPVQVNELQVDLMSFSAHKFYGPKGVGALYVRRRSPPVRLEPLVDGGAQENGLRSGTLNVPGIVGMSAALMLCEEELPTESERLAVLRNRLFQGLDESIENVQLNGPHLQATDLRLPGNLNCSFAFVDGEALMMSMSQLAVSSGSACTSTNPEPSHVLRALGISDDLTRASLRFGLGRFSTADEVEFAIETVTEAVTRLRKMSSLA
jgi:cysteine desulfurase